MGTPSHSRILIERAIETQVDTSSLARAMVSGEALPQALRAWFQEHRIDVFQCYATAESGLIAYETDAREGMVVNGEMGKDEILFRVEVRGNAAGLADRLGIL